MDKISRVGSLYSDTSVYSLSNVAINGDLEGGLNSKLLPKDVVFFRVDKITFEDKAPRKEAIENVLNTMRFNDIILVYLIKGDRYGVSFYYGLAKSILSQQNIAIDKYGETILKKSIEANFRGCVLKKEDSENILSSLNNKEYKLRVIEGVPGNVENNREEQSPFQGVDRIVDLMSGDEFMIVVTSRNVKAEVVRTLEEDLYECYDRLSPYTKMSFQKGENITTNTSITKTTGSNNGQSETEGTSVTIHEGESITNNESNTDIHKDCQETSGTSRTDNTNAKDITENKSHQKSSGTSESVTTPIKGGSVGVQENKSREVTNKSNEDWLTYLSDNLIKRIDFCKGKGMFFSSVCLFAKDDVVLKKLENSFVSIFAGNEGNKAPLTGILARYENVYRNLQIPIVKSTVSDSERLNRSLLSQYIAPRSKNAFLANWMSSKELSVITGMPQKEVNGLTVTKETEYGLNIKKVDHSKDFLNLGNLVQSGVERDCLDVDIEKDDLDKHIFVCGVTGSGKTTTCMTILSDSGYPFLVVEPAKTEYRILAKPEYENAMVYTLGNETIAPFRLNPLEFLEGESITSHIDMVRSCIEASYDMEAAIPQIIENALYECYEDKGWDIATNRNIKEENPFDDGKFCFPTITELIGKCKVVVDKQGFDDRLKGEYIGSINARLMGLIQGAKGLMLDVKRSIDFRKLIKQKVILELENIKSGNDKSLIMGFIISNVNEAIKAEFYENENKKKDLNQNKDKKTKEKSELSNRIKDLEDKISAIERTENFKKQKTVESSEKTDLIKDYEVLKNSLDREQEKEKQIEKEIENILNEIKNFKKFKHITLVEEAHRLLTKWQPGDSNNKKDGVEVFSNMLAEVRKYGECMIIADQIPNKLAEDVMKNTNTKIVHKIFAQDDKEAIGDTMALTKEQKEFLSSLQKGRAIVSAPGLEKPIQVKVRMKYDTSHDLIDEEVLKDNALEFYLKNYKRGIIPELLYFKNGDISKSDVEYIIGNHSLNERMVKDLFEIIEMTKLNNNEFTGICREFYDCYKTSEKKFGEKGIIFKEKGILKYLNERIFVSPNDKTKETLADLIETISFLVTEESSLQNISNSLIKYRNLKRFYKLNTIL